MPSRASELRRSLRAQGGAALIIFATVLIMGVAWFMVGALGKASVATAEREVITGRSLQAAKQALLAYIARRAADTGEDSPGRFPCPEHPSVAGTANAGIAAPIVGVASTSPCSGIGRLPWQTLGVDQIRDGYGEPLWYIVPTGTWSLTLSSTKLVINPGLAGQLNVDGVANVAVALIVAPGAPINTSAETGTPPTGCTAVNQQVAGRNTAPLVPANFLECRNNTVTTVNSYSTVMTAPWSNDRVITITTNEVMDAIAGSVTDRVQRQVAPAMYDYYNTTSLASWGQRFFPNSSIFNSPTDTDLCGTSNQREGKPPTATVASGSCDTDWTSGSATGLGAILGSPTCTSFTTFLRCDFKVLLAGIITPTVTATAPRIGYSFRRVDPSQITYQICGPFFLGCGAQISATTSNHGGSVNPLNGTGNFTFDVSLPALTVVDTVRVRIPHPTDALLADSRSAWFIKNDWGRYAYYGVARPATSEPGGTCNPGGIVTDCLTVNGMPVPNNDKRLVLLMMGRALAGQTWGSPPTSTNPGDYFESLTTPADAASNTTLGDRSYTAATVTSAFNDRVAVCPYKYYGPDGVTVLATACN